MEDIAILEISCQFGDTDIENMKTVTPWAPVNNSMQCGEEKSLCAGTEYAMQVPLWSHRALLQRFKLYCKSTYAFC